MLLVCGPVATGPQTSAVVRSPLLHLRVAAVIQTTAAVIQTTAAVIQTTAAVIQTTAAVIQTLTTKEMIVGRH